MTRLLELLLRSLARRFLVRVGSKTVITITGSIGKTSTTLAIAHLLRESGVNVRATLHNYNNNLGVPASILQMNLPAQAKNPFSWIAFIARAVWRTFRADQLEHQYFVLELGTDTPGDIAGLSWTKPDIAVVTAVAPEHMENFHTLEAVAAEELSIGEFSDTVLIHQHMVPNKYMKLAKNEDVYQYGASLLKENNVDFTKLRVTGEHSYDALAAALWVAKRLDLDSERYIQALYTYQSPPGRMRTFNGVRGSTVIDDTYNSSPEAAIAALKYMYSVSAEHRIVLLGNMNELGDVSPELHKQVGEYCNKTKLDLVVTLGKDANNYLAKAAKKNGCKVIETNTPKEAAEIILEQLKTYDTREHALILCKGSQNGVYAEETVKMLLADSSDQAQLVRQSSRWRQKKQHLWVEV